METLGVYYSPLRRVFLLFIPIALGVYFYLTSPLAKPFLTNKLTLVPLPSTFHRDSHSVRGSTSLGNALVTQPVSLTSESRTPAALASPAKMTSTTAAAIKQTVQENHSSLVQAFLEGKVFASPLVTKMLQKHSVLQQKMRRGEAKMRAIIARCVSNDGCAGLGDRLFGIVTLFVAALLTDRAFFVQHAKPVPQADFIIPNSLDWKVDTVETVGVKSSLENCLRGGCSYHGMMMPGPQCTHVMSLVFGAKDDLLLMTSNHRTECVLKMLLHHKVLPDSGTPGWDPNNEDSLRFWASNVSHMVLNHLFKFAPAVVSSGTSILKNSSLVVDYDSPQTRECLLCVHLRSGKNTYEGDRHHNLADFGKCAHMVEQQIMKAKTCPNKPSWIVISDHPQGAEIVGGKFARPLSTKNLGPIIHIQNVRSGEAQRSGASRLYTDLFVLTRCKYFVASLSTLGEVASIWHGPSVRRYDVEHDHTCSSTPLNIHNWQRDVHIPLQTWLNTLKH